MVISNTIIGTVLYKSGRYYQLLRYLFGNVIDKVYIRNVF